MTEQIKSKQKRKCQHLKIKYCVECKYYKCQNCKALTHYLKPLRFWNEEDWLNYILIKRLEAMSLLGMVNVLSVGLKICLLPLGDNVIWYWVYIEQIYVRYT